MHHLPDDLHDCLKSILSNTPSSEALEEQLPLIKKSILNLLQSIKQKQISLREQAEPKMLSPAASQIDLNDPSTKQAMETLASQDNLVERSSVRSNRNQMTVENINQGKRKENKMVRICFKLDKGSRIRRKQCIGIIS